VQRIDRTSTGVMIWAAVKALDAACPRCGRRSSKVHSRYDRKLADASVAPQLVALRLQTRRFFCGNEECPVTTFAEQVDGVTAKHSRRTGLARTMLEQVGLAPAGAGTAEELLSGTARHRDSEPWPFLAHLHRRWNEGCTDAARLHAEIRDLGYRGSQRSVRRCLQPLRASGQPAPVVPRGRACARRAAGSSASPPTSTTTNNVNSATSLPAALS